VAVDVRIAMPGETGLVAGILTEAATWADVKGAKLWQLDEVDPRRLAGDVEKGLFHIAWWGDEAAGTVKFQLDDPEFWPDDPGDHAAYIHRLAVRRRYAGGEVSTALMAWAVTRAASLGRQVLRLDCDAERLSLRAVYERFGFRYHSDRQVGPYFVARYEYPIR
jgi:GNAT superfamily N-acetyltransferase